MVVQSDQKLIRDELVQQQIIQAARHLFQIHGLEKVTMDDVAREIGKKRSSLYYYYKNKDEVLDAAIQAEMQDLIAGIARAVDQAPDLEQKISAYFNTRLKLAQKKTAFHSLLESTMRAGGFGDFLLARNAIHKRLRDLETPALRAILDFGVECGQLKPMKQKEQESLIFIMLSSIHGFKREAAYLKNTGKIESATELLISMILTRFKK